MAQATLIPAKTETKVVELAPAKVTLELTLEEAAQLRAIVGAMNQLSRVHGALTPLARRGDIEYLYAVREDGTGLHITNLSFTAD